MKETLPMKSMKKIISLITVISVLVSSLCLFSAGTASAAAAPVVKMNSTELCYSGRGLNQRTVYIQVKNPASDAKVYLHYQYVEGQAWETVQAAKTSLKATDGSKIWKVTFWSINTKYAIKYVGGGKTIWDNNGTKDYTRHVLGSPVNVKAEKSYYTGDNCYTVYACVRNIAYQKTVKVKYTWDNWKTTRTASLKFASMNDFDDSETWYYTINNIKDTKNFKFYLTYTVNGKTYTDKNFGQYYKYDFRKYS